MVDDLPAIEPEDVRSDRHEQVARTCRQLKQLARSLRLPVVALSRIGRRVEVRPEHRPTLRDLQHFEAIRAEADVILLLHRPEYYDPHDQPGIADVIIAKNWAGATDSVRLDFRRHILRFETMDRTDDLIPF